MIRKLISLAGSGAFDLMSSGLICDTQLSACTSVEAFRVACGAF
jgi:hypothetical protein